MAPEEKSHEDKLQDFNMELVAKFEQAKSMFSDPFAVLVANASMPIKMEIVKILQQASQHAYGNLIPYVLYNAEEESDIDHGEGD